MVFIWTPAGAVVNIYSNSFSTRIWRVEVHAANIHDGIAACDLIYPNFTGQIERAKKLLGDNAYRRTFADLIEELDDVHFECPSRPEGSKDFVLEKKRWIVERTFAWFNFFRRITKDLERTVENSSKYSNRYFVNH